MQVNTPPREPNVDDDEPELDEEDAVEIIELPDDDDDEENGLPEELEDFSLMDEEEFDEDLDTSEPEEVIEIEDDAVCSFTNHTGSVFCVDVNPEDANLAVSGGEDDKAFLWKADSGEVIKELTGHKDSVTCVEFSHNGKYVATADMAGMVQVWNGAEGTAVWSFESSDVEWIHWHPVAMVLLAGTVDGDIYMWKIPSGDCKIFTGNGQKTTTACILPSGKHVYAGYFDGSLILWDLKSAAPAFALKPGQGHSDSVNCVATSVNGALLISGSSDSSIRILNSSNGRRVASFDAGFPRDDDSETQNSIECVGFSNDTLFALSGSLSGVLGIWDISAQRLRHRCNHPVGCGITTLSLVKDVSSQVFTAALDGVVRLWDMRSGECLRQWCGHAEAILDMKVSNDGKTILTSSDDGTAKVFND